MSPILGIIASSKLTAAAGDFESIATSTVGSGGVATITFSSIPSDYTHLQLRYIGKNNRNSSFTGYLYLQINGSFGSYYHYLFGTGSVTAGAGVPTSTNAHQLQAPGLVTDTFGAGIVDILDYKNTNKNKTIRILSGTDINTDGIISLTSYLVNSTSAITSITIGGVDSSDIQQYSHFALYGIKSS